MALDGVLATVAIRKQAIVMVGLRLVITCDSISIARLPWYSHASWDQEDSFSSRKIMQHMEPTRQTLRVQMTTVRAKKSLRRSTV